MGTHKMTTTRMSTAWPSWRNLFSGAVRESLAAASSVARIGTQETRAWEKPICYVVDDNQGNVGVVEFTKQGAVAAVSARMQRHTFDVAEAIEMAPVVSRSALTNLCKLPLLQGEPGGVSAVFWTELDSIRGPEPWYQILAFGADLFQRELLSDAAWVAEAVAYYDISREAAKLAIALAARAVIEEPVLVLSQPELRQLVPEGAIHETEALDLLISDGLFHVAASERGGCE